MLFRSQQVTEAAFNLLDSHDTPRLLTICKDNEQKMKLAALFQLTFPGTPCIYYGDEFGMNGERDPDCRKCMVWEPEAQNQELLHFYKNVISLRNTYKALRSSDISFTYVSQLEDDGTLVYERRDGEERLRIALNARQEARQLVLANEAEAGWNVLLAEGGAEYIANSDPTTAVSTLSLSLPAYSFIVLKATNKTR